MQQPASLKLLVFSMKVRVYTSGCNTCGVKALFVARVKNKHPGAQVFNTRVRSDLIAEHLAFQKRAGMGGSPLDIVVEGDGERIVLLNEWK